MYYSMWISKESIEANELNVYCANQQLDSRVRNDISILLENFDKNSIDNAVTPLLTELAWGGLKGGHLEQK